LDLGAPVQAEISVDTTTVRVEARQVWTDTGVQVRAGDVLIIAVPSGSRWSPWPGDEFDANGSGGDPLCRCNVLAGVSHAALIGRIGENDPFLVGDRFRRSMGEAGPLYLGINDVDVYDNSGTLDVVVEVHER
jgi:hypothetical protein